MAIRAGLLSDFYRAVILLEIAGATRAYRFAARFSLSRAMFPQRGGRTSRRPRAKNASRDSRVTNGAVRHERRLSPGKERLLNVGDSRDSRRTNLIRCSACMQDDSSNTANSTISPARTETRANGNESPATWKSPILR